MDIAAIRAGIKTNLEAIDKLAVHSVVPPTLAPPCVLILTDTPFVQYQTANAKGLVTINFTLQVLVGRQDERRAQEQLDLYLCAGAGHTKSIIDAIAQDATLNGTCQDSIVTSASEYFSVEQGENQLGSANLSLTVYATRK